MIRLSTFTVPAAVVFSLEAVRHYEEMAAPYAGGLKVYLGSATAAVPLPGFLAVVAGAHVALALRLYVHAWALDESPNFREVIRKVSWGTHLLEWLLRAAWITGAVGMPTAYSVAGSGGHLLGVDVRVYLCSVVACLALWDLIMKDAVIEHSSQDPHALRREWIEGDAVIAIALLFPLASAYAGTSSGASNWLALFAVLALVLVGVVSLIQIATWLRAIVKVSAGA